jgi:hypothetical protein
MWCDIESQRAGFDVTEDDARTLAGDGQAGRGEAQARYDHGVARFEVVADSTRRRERHEPAGGRERRGETDAVGLRDRVAQVTRRVSVGSGASASAVSFSASRLLLLACWPTGRPTSGNTIAADCEEVHVGQPS